MTGHGHPPPPSPADAARPGGPDAPGDRPAAAGIAADLWSSTECFEYAEELCTALARAGVPTTQRFLVSKASYRRVHGRLARAWLRCRAYGGYPLLLAADFAARRRPTVSIVTTNTFYAPWLAARLAHGGRRVIHLVYDLFPEALIAAGVLAEGAVATRAIRGLTADTLRRAAANVFLGRRLLQHARNRYGEIPNAAIIPVGAAAEPFARSPPTPRPPGAAVTIVYCGNLGHMHDTRTLIDALHLPTPASASPAPVPVVIRFHASGPRLAGLRSALAPDGRAEAAACHDGVTVEIHPRIPDREWTATMTAADIGLVTMAPGAEAVVMPSKAYTAMVAGQAILAVCPLESDLADLVLEHRCGWVVVPEGGGDGQPRETDGVYSGAGGLRRLLAALANGTAGLMERRHNAFAAGHAHFSSDVLAHRWRGLMEEVARD